MEHPRPLPIHFGFVVLLGLAIYGLIAVALYHIPSAHRAATETTKINGTILSVHHDSGGVRQSQTKSVITVQDSEAKQHKILVQAGVTLMKKEWPLVHPGDRVSLIYEAPLRPNEMPELLVMRHDNFYIDRQMLDDRLKTSKLSTYRTGLIALAISLPWMIGWGWVRRKKHLKTLKQSKTADGDKTPGNSTEPSKKKILRYFVAGITLISSVYGLVLDGRTVIITVVGLFILIITRKVK